MSRREAWLSAGLVALVALAVRAWAVTQETFPRPEDVAYYIGVARSLLGGHGLTIDAIWSYGTPPLVFPRPAFEIWQPLATFLAAIPMAVFGGTFAAAQVASVIVGSAVAVLAWRLGLDVSAERGLPAGRGRWVALGTGLGAAVYLPLVLGSVQPDSTMPFALLVLGATLVARRVLGAIVVSPEGGHDRARESRTSARPGAHPKSGGARSREAPLALDRALVYGLVALGVLIGLAALARNEAIWLALAWAIVAWWATRPIGRRLRAALPLVAIPAIAAIVVYAPWALRNWAVFGTPLPGQALENALFLRFEDVFAWTSPPTLSSYLAAGPATLLGLRVDALTHDLGNDLLLLGIPISVLGLAGLPWTARGSTLRLLTIFSIVTFAITTLVFPIATLAGTFLHAAGAIQVLVLVSAALALDAVIERVRVMRSWTRPVAWLGTAAIVTSSVLLGTTLLIQDAATARSTEARYADLPGALAAAGAPLPTDGSPVVTDHPIWLATADGVPALSLPDERPADVLNLANAFDAKLLIVDASNEGQWPEILDPEEPRSECFQPVPLPAASSNPALADLVVFRIVCYAPSQPGQP